MMPGDDDGRTEREIAAIRALKRQKLRIDACPEGTLVCRILFKPMRRGVLRPPSDRRASSLNPCSRPRGVCGIGRRQPDTGASAVIAGRCGGRIWQRDDKTIEAFEARVAASSPGGDTLAAAPPNPTHAFIMVPFQRLERDEVKSNRFGIPKSGRF
jgi:hypothetical protein